MEGTVRVRFWLETVFGVLAGALGLLTLVWQDWIEAIFRVDPDHGNGSAEWIAVVVLLGAALVLGALARRDRRRLTAGATA
jgi:drug/metabolite transporter (DMT)-like permease